MPDDGDDNLLSDDKFDFQGDHLAIKMVINEIMIF